AYWDYNDMMKLVETLFEKLALSIFGKTQIPAYLPDSEDVVMIEMKAPWKRITMKDSIKEYGKIDVDKLSDEQMRKMLLESGHVEPKKLQVLTRGLLIAAMFEVYVEPHLIQPHHIIDHPIETTPLCKPHRDPAARAEGLVERFESFILT